MTTPKPFTVFPQAGDAASEAEIAAARRSAYLLENRKELGQLSSLHSSTPLEGGGYIFTYNIGGVTKNIVVRPQQIHVPTLEQEVSGLAQEKIPMFLSGRIVTPTVPYGAGVTIQLTSESARRAVGYDPEKTPPKFTTLKAFNIPPSSTYYPEFQPTGFLTPTQYAKVYPSWFSGRMAKLVQLSAGFGKQNDRDLKKTEGERTLSLPDKLLNKLKVELKNTRLPGYNGLPPDNGELHFDYKFYKTEGVVNDGGGNLWLVRITPGNVWAMPLPMIPYTTVPSFRLWVEGKGDSELITALDEFGGIPSGEGFPRQGKDFEAWVRAGVIINLGGTSDFYEGGPLGESALGWSFSATTNEAAHCCYVFGSDGMQRARMYRMKFTIAPAERNGRLPEKFDVTNDPFEMAALNFYLSRLYEALAPNMEDNAVKYKLRRVPDEVLSRARDFTVSKLDSELTYWRNKTMEPITAGSASCSKVREGRIHSSAKFAFQPQFKMPDPFMGGCISHDFNPIPVRTRSYPPASLRFDTVVFCHYVGDTLKTVKFCRDDRKAYKDVEADNDECMLIGSWTTTTNTGSTQLYGAFYTSDYDERDTAPDVTTVEIYSSQYHAADKIGYGEFDHFFAIPGYVFRDHHFLTTTEKTVSEGFSLEVAVCVPYLSRDAVLYPKRSAVTGKSWSWQQGVVSVNDPYVYSMYTLDPVGHWWGGVRGQRYEPSPKYGNPVWVSQEHYAVEGGYETTWGPCVGAVDKGPWLSVGQNIINYAEYGRLSIYMTSGPGGNKNYGEARPVPDMRPKLRPSKGWRLKDVPNHSLDFAYHYDTWRINPDKTVAPDKMYFLASPDEVVGVFRRDATKNCLGEAEYYTVSENVNGQQVVRGYSAVAPEPGLHFFIGVING